jgi:hypothetical protein
MSDIAYDNATARRDKLAKSINNTQQSLDEMRQELRSIDIWIEQWKKFAGVIDLDINTTTVPLTPKPQNLNKNSKKEEVAAAAVEIIKALGEPLARSSLLARLVNKGLVIKGADPEVVLSTMLWRTRNKVVRLKKGGYWAADLPSPDGSYVPGQLNDEDHLSSMTQDEKQAAIAGPEPDSDDIPDSGDPYDLYREQQIDEEAKDQAPPKKDSFFD